MPRMNSLIILQSPVKFNGTVQNMSIHLYIRKSTSNHTQMFSISDVTAGTNLAKLSNSMDLLCFTDRDSKMSDLFHNSKKLLPSAKISSN